MKTNIKLSLFFMLGFVANICAMNNNQVSEKKEETTEVKCIFKIPNPNDTVSYRRLEFTMSLPHPLRNFSDETWFAKMLEQLHKTTFFRSNPQYLCPQDISPRTPPADHLECTIGERTFYTKNWFTEDRQKRRNVVKEVLKMFFAELQTSNQRNDCTATITYDSQQHCPHIAAFAANLKKSAEKETKQTDVTIDYLDNK